MNYIYPILAVFFASFFGAYAAYLLKTANNKRLIVISKNQNLRYKYLFLGALTYGFSSIIFIVALKFTPLSVIFPVTASTYIWSYFIAKNYFKEHISYKKIIGLSFIIFGIILIALS